MERMDNFSMRRKIELERDRGVSVYVDFCNVSKDSRNRIEEAVDNFLNSVSGIMNEEHSVS